MIPSNPLPSKPRYEILDGLRGGFLWCSLLLVVLLAMPRVGGEAHGLWNGMYEAACILLFFPVVVLMGRGASPRAARPGSASFSATFSIRSTSRNIP